MFRLAEFLKSRGHLLLFIILEAVALLLLFNRSLYHNSVLLSSSNFVTGHVTEIAGIANAYLGLQEANVALLKRNADLERQVLMLQSQIERITLDSLSYTNVFADSIQRPFPYEYLPAKVVGNILYGNSNFITINKGYKDGLRPDMGVVGPHGVIGVIKTVSQHYAKVLPIINRDFAISCKIGNNEHYGILKWDGKDIYHSLVTNLPKHIHYGVGDSVYTTSYSTILPENVFIGTIEGEGSSEDDNFYALKVRLSSSFDNLKYVYVVLNYERAEMEMIRNSNESGILTTP